MMKDRISVPVAALILGCSPQKVRERMKRGLWDIGTACRGNGKTKDYDIYRSKLERHIGREIRDEEIESCMQEVRRRQKGGAA